MGKGSKRRPRLVSREEMDRRWEETFGKVMRIVADWSPSDPPPPTCDPEQDENGEWILRPHNPPDHEQR